MSEEKKVSGIPVAVTLDGEDTAQARKLNNIRASTKRISQQAMIAIIQSQLVIEVELRQQYDAFWDAAIKKYNLDPKIGRDPMTLEGYGIIFDPETMEAGIVLGSVLDKAERAQEARNHVVIHPEGKA